MFFYESSFPCHTSISPKNTGPSSQSTMNTWISSLLYYTSHNPSILGPAPNPNASLPTSLVLSLVPHPFDSPLTNVPCSSTPSILGPPPCSIEPLSLSNVHCRTVPSLASSQFIDTSPSQPLLPDTSSDTPATSLHPMSNIHPMKTRSKSGIHKPKVAFNANTNLDYLDAEPPSFIIAST